MSDRSGNCISVKNLTPYALSVYNEDAPRSKGVGPPGKETGLLGFVGQDGGVATFTDVGGAVKTGTVHIRVEATKPGERFGCFATHRIVGTLAYRVEVSPDKPATLITVRRRDFYW